MKSNSRHCYLYVLDTLADWEIAFITAELNSGRYLNSPDKWTIEKVGSTLIPITTMGGMRIVPDKAISDVTFAEGDLLILPGADTWADANNRGIIEAVSDLIDKQVVVAAICGATIALANQGLLNHRSHTSNDKEVLKMFCPEYSGSNHYVNAPAVADGNLITASGLAPLEFSYEVFKKIGAMKESTLEAWYHLYKTREAKYFFSLMESMNTASKV